MNRSRLWAEAAIAGVVVYVAIDVALVFLRPHFSVLHNAESDYGSKGPYDWLMDLNFVLRCLLSLAAVRALALSVPQGTRMRVALGLISVWAVASGLLAFFPDDPVGTTAHGLAPRVHLALAGIAFIGIAVGARTATRALAREPRWRPAIVPLAVLSWGAFVPVILLGKAHLRPHSLGGLWEKVFLGVELAWILLAAVWVARERGEEVEAEAVPAAAP
ncbi:MAG TPA: DUF998 domain-containing protein [Gaiellaceae bacterium]|nr:DUF998 domain-containing protein [Gaiellaceae bacterium]